jgi:hypothetical protein
MFGQATRTPRGSLKIALQMVISCMCVCIFGTTIWCTSLLLAKDSSLCLQWWVLQIPILYSTLQGLEPVFDRWAVLLSCIWIDLALSGPHPLLLFHRQFNLGGDDVVLPRHSRTEACGPPVLGDCSPPWSVLLPTLPTVLFSEIALLRPCEQIIQLAETSSWLPRRRYCLSIFFT